MYQREVLGLEDTRKIIDAILAEASKEPDRPLGVAVTDEHGELIACAVMDGRLPMFLDMAIRKAYSAARWRRDTRSLGDLHARYQRQVASWGDPRLTDMVGGVCIRRRIKGAELPPGGPADVVLGGIGVAGRWAEEDEELALLGLSALNIQPIER